MSDSISYSDAGVSIDNANLAVAKIRNFAKSTFNERTLTEIGSFGGMFSGAFPGMSAPILVASADGVGTKLKIAFDTGIHSTIGQDLVNHCVNDILVQGARPLFFLDYFATGVLSPDVTASVVEGISLACQENGCVLSGRRNGGNAGFYAAGDMIWPVSSSASSINRKSSTAKHQTGRRRARLPVEACRRTVIRSPANCF
jgi:phosphoribosylformylglycinamidine cyclo-ligase